VSEKDTTISVENLSKRYELGQIGATSFRESVERWLLKLRGRDSDIRMGITDQVSDLGPQAPGESESTAKPLTDPSKRSFIWALRDVSFEVERGEVLGIIGKNGTGKSTLLKILTRITEPTSGRAVLRGRVSSLLEVGTGFHPELTGRENVYLNGTILGMRKAEIDRKFDEIVAFSQIEQFIDTPVKRYSSGMHVRLGFAVAAHLEPEILLVDEVLAVGDAEFRKKCVGKMSDVARSGRTVLFVSHSMNAITQLCGRCIWLDKGRVMDIGAANEIVTRYLLSGSHEKAETSFDIEADKDAQYTRVRVLNERGEVSPELSCDETVTLELVYRVTRTIPGLYLTFFLQNAEGYIVLLSDWNDFSPGETRRLRAGTHTFSIRMPKRVLGAGTYFVTVGSAAEGTHLDNRESVCTFALHDRLTVRGDGRPGMLSTRLKWCEE